MSTLGTEATWLGALLLVWALVSFGYRAVGLRAVGRLGSRGERGGVRDEHREPTDVALLRPVCNAPAYLEDCLGSLCRAAEVGGAPVFVSIEDSADPAHKDVTRVCEANPNVSLTVRTGNAGPGENRKIANLMQLDSDCEAEVIVLSDADIRVAPDYVAAAASAFADPSVGFATAPYRSVAQGSWASRCDALLTNLHFLPNACVANEIEGLHFGLGSTLAVRREALVGIGGLAAIVDESGDDSALALRVQARGWKLAWLPFLVDHVLADVGWRAAFARHVRCARISRSLRPVGFLALGALTHGWLPALALAGLSANASAVGWLAPALWWGGMLALQWRRRRDLHLAPRDLALSPVVDLMDLTVMVAAHWGRPTPP